MNVYDKIAANNRSTVFILSVFPITLLGLVFLLSFLLVITDITPYYSPVMLTLYIFPWVFLVVTIWILVSYFKGDDMIRGMARAHPVSFEDNKELYRLVENTAIMAGLPMPAIFLIEDESLNAFAMGRNPKRASITFSTGITRKLEKSELQAVIAHELAHIGNRDTRLMVITITGIGCFIFFGELLCRVAARGGRGKSGSATLVFLAAGLLCLIFGYLIAPILRFALSRRREYNADATAVKITRSPDDLANALTKIAEDPRIEALDSARLASNMCIANPAKASFISKLYMTHPPIEDRVAELRKMAGG